MQTTERALNREPTRREFFRGIGRGAALAGIALLAAAVTGWRRKPARREKCTNQGICRGCSAFADCGLPQALSARRAAKG